MSSADPTPTLLELTNATPFRGIQGWSLVPVLTGRTDAHREALFVEEDQPFGLEGLPGPVLMRTVITAEGRLTRNFGSGFTELYDHRTDPDELDNVAGQDAYAGLERRLTEALLEEMANLADEATAPTDAA